MRRVFFPLLLGLVALLALAACGTSEKSDTAGEAVTLLQDIEDNSLRVTLLDGVDALNLQDGYLARFSLDTHGPEDQSTVLLLTLQVDAAQAMQVEIQHGLVTGHYVVLPAKDTTTARTIIRLDGPEACIASETSSDPDTAADSWLLNDGLHSIFAEAASALTAEQILAVTKALDDDSDTLLLGRKVQQYLVEARLNEALVIAREAATSAQPTQPQVENFTFGGALFLDNGTAALLKFDAQYEEPDTGQAAQVSFVVTQWGNVAPIVPPANLEALEHCP